MSRHAGGTHRPLFASPRNLPGLTPAIRKRLQRFIGAMTLVSPWLAAKFALLLFLTPPRRAFDDVDLPILARAHRRRVPFRGGELQVFEWGTSGPAVMLLHGWGSHAARFGGFVQPLIDAGYRVIGFDAPAHGESTGKRSDLPQFRAALEAVLEECGPVEAIVAHSLGAAATVWWATENDPGQVRAVVLVGMPRDTAFMVESFAEMLALTPAVRTHFAAHYHRAFGESHEVFSTLALAPRLGLPSFIVHDRDDEVAPFPHALAFAEAAPHGRLFTTEGLHHSGLLRDPATIAAIVDFVRSSRGKTAPDPASRG